MNHDQLRLALRDAGLRATLQRIAALGALANAERPLTHPELCQRLVARPQDRVTVWRNLLDFARTGLARRVGLGSRPWLFEYVRELPHERLHPHFSCTSCGAVICVEGLKIDARHVRGVRAVKRGDFEVHLRGLCDACTHPEDILQISTNQRR
jgi:Fur family ferric uptake transcriptional regulator